MLTNIGPILALDPGGTTGTCLFLPPKEVVRDTKQLRGCFAYTEIGPDEHHLVLDQFLHQCLMLGTEAAKDQMSRFALPPTTSASRTPKLTVVNERFEYRKEDSRHREKIEYISAEYVGVVKRFARLNYRNVEYVEHSPSLKDGFWKNPEKIKMLGLWAPGKRHAMDALRHLLYHITFTLSDRSLYKFLQPKRWAETI